MHVKVDAVISLHLLMEYIEMINIHLICDNGSPLLIITNGID